MQDMTMATCIIFGNTVTRICSPDVQRMMCKISDSMLLMPIPPQHLSISGTLTTSNLIMASWNREMWQSVVNRVLE
ncbi:hypothetical protein KIN20_030468 [Parelaphostrongylus tenuis]|uniref:Uncharacterized protein n=1 Tax=Parelaphostrongylus tenuis TaxID=148309 RepID=A0AAD5WG54_PARTN|nr:hypothetical protein KIN20_030468 [Parelaphostrongylus tenuis]